MIVSDFYTPDFFLPVQGGHVRYSFTGAISSPRTILLGGYISWMDPTTGRWWQQTWFRGDAPVFVDLGIIDISAASPRTIIDTLTLKSRNKPHLIYGLPQDNELLTKQQSLFKSANASNAKRAKEWQDFIEHFKSQQ